MARLARKLLRRPSVAGAAAWIGAMYLEFAWMTSRWRMENLEALTSTLAAGRPAIMCVWHGRLLLAPRIRNVTFTALASHHADGQLAAMIMRRRGIGTISGSSARGGAAGLRKVIRSARDGEVIVITPDGPRGPRMRAAAGAVVAAKAAGAVIIPAAMGVSRRRLVGRWDRFVIPLPLARGIARCGTPIRLPDGATRDDVEAARAQLERELILLTQAVDADLGVEIVHPGPAPVKDGSEAGQT